MAYPPPPGHASLPPRPPPSTVSSTSFRPNNGSSKPAFTAFAPRAIAGSGANRTSGAAHYSAPPVTNYSVQASYSAAPQPTYQAPPQYDSNYQTAATATATTPQIRNPFVPAPPTSSTPNPFGNYDPEYEAQLQQWQSAYTSRDEKPGFGVAKSAAPTVKTDSSTQSAEQEAQKTVQRSGGGSTWTDPSLLEWDPAHFRIFVGNLAGEVTDDSLLKAFAKYPSVQKARVIRDKRTTKSKGYGFVSFANGDEYFQAAKDMQGKYIGSHPVLIKRAMTEVRPTVVQDRKGKNNKNKNRGAGGHNKVEHGGIEKKIPKTKGGLRVLG
ncbi:hypothetical protein H2198_008347 [Neophaeococcomyces mojaviensis]|uniref:Uncharacterized protein n=1 Tax=Neophaeococcomyces mojaviensis TaxID=3383035 RepID=A0ACC2ZXC5_9EURO|nr:hypothetical protein H2198_008347 [Knufia sp. JES_112]